MNCLDIFSQVQVILCTLEWPKIHANMLHQYFYHVRAGFIQHCRLRPVLQAIFLWTLISRQLSQDLDCASSNTYQRSTSQNVDHEPPDSKNAGFTPPPQRLNIELSAEQNQMIEEAFNLFNTGTEGLDEFEPGMDNSAQHRSGLDESEFASAVKALGFSGRNHKETAKELMKKVKAEDKIGNFVSLEEFTNFMKGQLTGDPDEEINAIFEAISENNCITKVRLGKVAAQNGVSLTDDELHSMFDDSVEKAEEGIGYVEFVQILKHSTWV